MVNGPGEEVLQIILYELKNNIFDCFSLSISCEENILNGDDKYSNFNNILTASNHRKDFIFSTQTWIISVNSFNRNFFVSFSVLSFEDVACIIVRKLPKFPELITLIKRY